MNLHLNYNVGFVSFFVVFTVAAPPRRARQRWYNRTFYKFVLVFTSCVCFLSFRIFPFKFFFIRYSYVLVQPLNSFHLNGDFAIVWKYFDGGFRLCDWVRVTFVAVGIVSTRFSFVEKLLIDPMPPLPKVHRH